MSQLNHSSNIAPLEQQQSLASRQKTMRHARTILIILLVLMAAGAARTLMSRSSNAKVLENRTAESSEINVRVAPANGSAADQTLVLPGTLLGLVQTPISARSSGYLKKWYKDIGSAVSKGDLLAEIESPEIDQQLSQMIAMQAQLTSSLALAQSTVARWEDLRKKDAVSQQELDEKRSGFVQARANLAAADANVERLRQLESFKRIVAPFSGIITKRNVDVGDLIDAGGGAGRALFILTQTDPLKVYVNLPQSYTQLVKAGQEVDVVQAELGGRKFRGKVVRTAGAIDTVTRTMQMEVALSNKDGLLLPGAFVQVLLPMKASKTTVISTSTLMFRGDGISVATVSPSGDVKIQKIKLGRNFGNRIEVISGLDGSELLILNPPDALRDGEKVKITKNNPKDAKKGDASEDGEKENAKSEKPGKSEITEKSDQNDSAEKKSKKGKE